VRAAGARIRLISDGDLSAGISAAVAGTNIHACIGIGGAPEGVLTAAAIKCLNGEIQARLVFDPERLGVDRDKVPPASEVIERLKSMGITDANKIYDTDDLAPGKENHFCRHWSYRRIFDARRAFLWLGQAHALAGDDQRIKTHSLCRYDAYRRRARYRD